MLGRGEFDHRFFRNTAFLLAERSVRIGVAFAGWVVIARACTPEAFGSLAVSYSIVTFLGIVSALGTEHAALASLSQERSGQRRAGLVLSIALIRFVVALSLVILSFFIMSILPSRIEGTALISTTLFILVLALPALAAEAFELQWIAEHRSFLALKARLIASVIGFSVKCLAWSFEADVEVFAWILAAEIWLYAAFCMIMFLSKVNSGNLIWPKRITLATLLSTSWPFLVAAVLVSGQLRVDQAVVLVTLSAQDLGYYMVAIRIIDGLLMAGSILSASVFSRSVNSASGAAEAPPNPIIFASGFGFMTVAGVVFALAVMLFSGVMVDLFFGDEYASAKSVLILLSLCLPFALSGMLANRYLVITGLSRIAVPRAGLAFVVSIILALAGGLLGGLVGLAIGVFIGHVFGSFLVFFLFKSTRPLARQQALGLTTMPFWRSKAF